MSNAVALFKEIESLSEQVEKLLEKEDESACADLLKQRQHLLESLAALEKIGEVEQQAYFNFLISIQERDVQSVAFIASQKRKILSADVEQKKATKAVNLYQKYSE